jgi:hypothetical protein
MSSYDSFNSTARPQVRVVHHGGGQVPSLGVSRRGHVKAYASPTRWIVRSVTIATTAFALLDVILLVSGGRH